MHTSSCYAPTLNFSWEVWNKKKEEKMWKSRLQSDQKLIVVTFKNFKAYLRNILPVTVKRLHVRDLLLAVGKVREHWQPRNQCDQKKLSNVYKSCPKMISQEKWMTLTHLQKLPKNVRDLDKLIVSKGFKKLPKVQKIAQSGHTARNSH